MPTLQQPEAYIGQVDRLLDGEGNFAGRDSQDYFQNFLAAFEAWILRHRSPPAQRADDLPMRRVTASAPVPSL